MIKKTKDEVNPKEKEGEIILEMRTDGIYFFKNSNGSDVISINEIIARLDHPQVDYLFPGYVPN